MRRWPRACGQAWAEEDIDPLLSTLTSLRNRRLQLEADMRLLIAYGRCFTHPRPYKLIDLANAAGMSISGIRTAYDTDEIDQAAEILERPPTAPPQPSGNGLGPGAMGATGLRGDGFHHYGPQVAVPASWRVLADGPQSVMKVILKACRSGRTPRPGRIELQPATAGYSTGSCAELTPGQAGQSPRPCPGSLAARHGRRGRTHALPAGRARCGGAAPRFR